MMPSQPSTAENATSGSSTAAASIKPACRASVTLTAQNPPHKV